jgi:ribosomal protein S18 acetylase RimI-like enzyme
MPRAHAHAMHSRSIHGVVIRPLRDGDGDTVLAVFERLSAESRRRRFGGAKTHLSPAELELLARVDAEHHVLVAYADGDPRPAGLARLVRDGSAAEVAFEVADDQHGRGIGTALTEALAADARAAGIAELHATVAADNARAMSLFARVSHRLRATWLGAERRVVAALD